MTLKARLVELLERTRLRLASPRGGPVMATLGLAVGLLAGGVIMAFRQLVEGGQALFLPFGGTENYEALPLGARILAPAAAGLAAGLLFQAMGIRLRVGIVHVMERLSYHEAHQPARQAVAQFLGGAISLIGGLSLGREGPSVHLGAAAGSLLGQRLGFPNNSIRTMVACGTAAAIAASFNTPLAGVVFAMEVIMMEYTIAGFTPVILAAVSATALSRAAYGDSPAFMVPQLALANLWELPWIVLMGIIIGALAAILSEALLAVHRRTGGIPIWARMLIGGLVVGLFGAAVPEVLGIGYDTVNGALTGDFTLSALVIIAGLKLVASAVSAGTGHPGGLIGPSLVIGAAAGAAFGMGLSQVADGGSSAGLYAMLGMGAMMGAILQAPLSALLALLELTANPHIIMPAMLAIVSANLAARELFGADSIQARQMQEQGLDYSNDPVSQSLRRVGVAAVMSRDFRTAEQMVDREAARALLVDTPRWIIVRRDPRRVLLPASDLARFLESNDADPIDLLELPGHRRQLASIHPQATLQEGLRILEESGAEALCVERPIAPMVTRLFGVLTRSQVEAAYRFRP